MPRVAAAKCPRITVRGTQRGAIIRGVTAARAFIDAVNLSASAAERTGYHDVATIGCADDHGAFTAKLPMRRGDVVRLRARDARGKLGPWQTFTARGIGGAPRPPRVALFRFGLRAKSNDRVLVFNLSPARPLAAPGTELVLENVRTGARSVVRVNEKSTIPRGTSIEGVAGDEIAVRVGKHALGSLVTPPHTVALRSARDRVSPWGYHQKLGFVPELRVFHTPLFARAMPRIKDVVQSELPNCYLASAADAVACTRPEALVRSIVRVRRGHYRVRFRAIDARTGRAVARDVEVSSALWVRPSGQLLYGSSGEIAPALWWPLLEKAFARLKGSYRKIGKGGCADLVLQALLGRPARRFFVEGRRVGEADRLWREMTKAQGARRPVVAGTAPPFATNIYRNTGIVPDHAYAVHWCREVRGVRMVGLRNPWGEDASRPCRARKNGLLELSIDDFVRFFYVLFTVR